MPGEMPAERHGHFAGARMNSEEARNHLRRMLFRACLKRYNGVGALTKTYQRG